MNVRVDHEDVVLQDLTPFLIVYMARHENDDPVVKGRVGTVACPPTQFQADELARLYQLPNKDSLPDAAISASFIDIKVTRYGIVNFEERTNGNDATEVIVKSPLVPDFNRFTMKYSFLLYFGPFSVGVKHDRTCWGF